MEEACVHVRTLHKNEKGKTAKLPKRQVNRIEQQSGRLVEKILSEGRSEYLEGSKYLKAHGIEVYLPLYTRFRRIEGLSG